MEIKKIVACQVIRDTPCGLFRYYWRFCLDSDTYALRLIHYALCCRPNRTRKYIATAEWLADGVHHNNKMEKDSRLLPLKEIQWDDDVSKAAIVEMHKRIKIAARPAEVSELNQKGLSV